MLLFRGRDNRKPQTAGTAPLVPLLFFCGVVPFYFLPRIRFAFALIFDADAGERRPALTCCVARAFALAAWLASGIGYLR